GLPLAAFGARLEEQLVEHIVGLTDYQLDADEYAVLRGNRFRANWDFRFHKSRQSGMGTNMAEILLRRIKVPVSTARPSGHIPFIEKPPTRIMVASGLYDFVTPYYAMELALLRAGLEPSQFEMHLYKGGHMMYLEKETGHQLAADIRSFIRGAETPS
ncbi:MAG: hypothetical protein AAF331_15155, partial [Pseudomonadota bacterium]